MNRLIKHARIPVTVPALSGTFIAVFFALCGQLSTSGQGTFQVTFDGPPTVAPGTAYLTTNYSELGRLFTPIVPNDPASAFVRQGGAYPGYPVPDGSTAYLQALLGSTLRFSLTDGSAFGLVSVDLAGYSDVAPDFTVTFLGYRSDASTVSKSFSGSGIAFQTFYFGQDFSNLARVDIPNASWSLDNLVASVPEPSGIGLGVLGLLLALARRQKTTTR